MFVAVYIVEGQVFLSITLGLKCHVPIALNLDLMFVLWVIVLKLDLLI
jgi:hypothetical protein